MNTSQLVRASLAGNGVTMASRAFTGGMVVLVVALPLLCDSCVAQAETLENDTIVATFDAGGLVSLHDKRLNQTLRFSADHWSFIIEHRLVDSRYVAAKKQVREAGGVRYFFHEGEFDVEVLYQLKPGWRFVTKQLFVTTKKTPVYTVRHVDVFHGRLDNRPAAIVTAGLDERSRKNRGLGDYAAFVRMDDSWGGMFMVQNPFSVWRYDDGDFSMDYRADLVWDSQYGPFVSDRACVGVYALTGQLNPSRVSPHGSWLMRPEWNEVEGKLDAGEIESAVQCVRAFLLYRPTRSERIHVPWCENDYQINVATPEGQAQFKRIVDTCSALGIRHMLYTVRNEDVARQSDASDNWHWEHLLWLNQGIQIRQGQWDPRKDPLPPVTRQLMDYARSKNVRLMAYVYPSLAFEQNNDWLTRRHPNQDQLAANLGIRSFQDWLIDNLIGFMRNTGASGYAFDYWSLRCPGTSAYSQWFGTRRVLEALRRQAPAIVIDGRQTYHGYGPWTWLAGNYPHPTGGDEQPESFEPFPDLHFDRCSATQQRLTSYWYRNIQFCPTELMPGFIGHQTARANAAGDVVYNTDFNVRDWDYLGWKFSLLSSIATAPFAHCVDMIPARDPREFELFSRDHETHQFIRDWFDWTDQNADVLRNMRSIIGPPAVGRADGTAAMAGDHGFVFLFNPNHRKVTAEFALDASIGLTEGTEFIIAQLFPEKGKYIGARRTGVFHYGDRCSALLDGTTAWVLEVRPASGGKAPLLFNVRGEVTLDRSTLRLTHVRGEVGTTVDGLVMLPGSEPVRALSVNGRNVNFEQHGRLVSFQCRFQGEYFSHNQAVTRYGPSFQGTSIAGSFVIPERIFTQLNRRKAAWSFDWTEEDLACTWLAPERLLLYVQIAEPDWKMKTSMKIDGEPVELRKAFSSRTPGRLRNGKGHNTFTGFYTDVSSLKPGRKYRVELVLPSGLKPGQFQGLFFENVETEYTQQIVPVSAVANPPPSPTGSPRREKDSFPDKPTATVAAYRTGLPLGGSGFDSGKRIAAGASYLVDNLVVKAGGGVHASGKTPPLPDTYELWSGPPLPKDPARIPFVEGIVHRTIHRPAADGYKFLHGAAILEHEGVFYATWANSPVNENGPHETLQGRRSTDGGVTWSPLEVIGPGFPGAERHSHGVLLVHDGKVWAIGARFGVGQPAKRFTGLKAEAFVLDPKTDGWESRGVVMRNCWPCDAPVKMGNGNYITGGQDKDGLPVVAISHGDDLTQWDSVLIPYHPKLAPGFAETTVWAEGTSVIAVIRGGAGVAWVATSNDGGRTWTAAQPSNFPMPRSKAYLGKLSTGQLYLLSNFRDRNTLVVSVSKPGERTLSKMFRVRHGESIPPRYPGKAKGKQWSYPYACEHRGKLYVVYSVGKEECGLSVIPVASLANPVPK